MKKVKKILFVTLIILYYFSSLNAQIPFGEQQVITTDAIEACSVYATDLDGDGDMDVLSASMDDDKIAWYENDGSGNFGDQQIIADDVYQASSVYASDLDEDGDMDVLAASSHYMINIIYYFENDGTGDLSTRRIITTEVNQPYSVYTADLDGDDDMDVLSASKGDDKIVWYVNKGSSNFWQQHVITTDAQSTQSVYASDLDGDQDMDVLSASPYDNKIAWYENDGSGNFGDQQIITNTANFALSVYASDLDGDGDIDVLSASCNDNKIAWYENDGSGNFGDQQVITNAANCASSVYASDLDGDGDMDVLSASSGDDKIAWYENDGIGGFGVQQIITTSAEEAQSVYTTDIDNDGDIDVLSASWSDNKIAWYQSLMPPIAHFIAEPLCGTTPLFVQFSDSSKGGRTIWFWDFGDGNTSTERNPMHTYEIADTFTVSLTVTGPEGSDTETKEDYIIVTESTPVAQFDSDITSGDLPLNVQFSDSSTGSITSWEWVFGDGNTSTEQNPLHTYEIADTLTVSLTVTGPGGSDTEIKEDYIIVSDPSSVVEKKNKLPLSFNLYQNYPNPFNPLTKIKYDVKEACKVNLVVYNLNGQIIKELVNSFQQPGKYSINLNMQKISSGIYFYKIQMGDFRAVKKMAKIE